MSTVLELPETLTREEYEVLLRHDLATFIERSFLELNPETVFIPSQHIEVLATKLERCSRGELRRLIINLPPRSLKSHAASVAFVAWLFGHNPAAQVICASYGQELADKHARDCRTVVMSPFYRRAFPGTLLSTTKLSVNEFHTTRHGCRLSTSIGGVLTGRGADMIIIDDPLKPDEAMSEARRKAVNEWFDNSLLSRLNDKNKGVIIIVMQRLHMDDLVGHVLEQGGWDVLKFPAVAEEDETFEIESVLGKRIYRRQPGELLQPEREPQQVLDRARRELGAYNFSAQYQQQPIPVEGNIVKNKWLLFYTPDEKPEEFSHIAQSWDTANTSGELNDYSVCTTWGVWEKRFYLLHVYRERLDFPELKRKVKELAKRFKADVVLVEDKASGTQLIQELKHDEMSNIKPHTPRPGNDKVMRLRNQTTAFENELVLFPKEAPWLVEYLKELTAFPGGKHDDQADSTSQALEYLTTRRPSIYDVL
jgi:predicted phage terminase large subunit-like protein